MKDEDTSIHMNNHFQTFGQVSKNRTFNPLLPFQSLLVLFRCCTGEVWQDIMMGCIKSPDVKCDPMRFSPTTVYIMVIRKRLVGVMVIMIGQPP